MEESWNIFVTQGTLLSLPQDLFESNANYAFLWYISRLWIGCLFDRCGDNSL